MKKINQKSGFTVLYASLVGGLVLAVGAAILLLAIKQIALSAAGRESQFAFYAADSGMECALYINRASRIDEGEGGNSCPDGKFPKPPTPEDCSTFLPDYSCAGSEIRDFTVSDEGNEIISTFSIGPDKSSGDPIELPNICADIVVTRTNSDTKIVSRGYSTCIPSENRFERAIQTDF